MSVMSTRLFRLLCLGGGIFRTSLAGLHGCELNPTFVDLAESAKSWCDPNKVPASQRVPEKLRGLYYFKGNELNPFAPQDWGACFSLGTWDATSLTMTLSVGTDFLVRDTFRGHKLAVETQGTGMYYTFSFSDQSLSYAIIRNHRGAIRVGTYDMTEESDETDPGARYRRESYVVKMFPYNTYEVIRLLDGKGHVNEKYVAEMLSRQEDTGWRHGRKVCANPDAGIFTLELSEAADVSQLPRSVAVVLVSCGLLAAFVGMKMHWRPRRLSQPLLEA